MIKVGVNGYGVIGKRVADAVSKQDDMNLIGIAKREADYKARAAARSGIAIYSTDRTKFDTGTLKSKGTLDDLISASDVIVDCTPEGVATENKKLYENAGVKAIWQGGEDHELTGLSFNAYANYEKSLGAKYVRVVSCNTTGLVRTLFPLYKAFGIEEVNAFLARRAADPAETKKGPINALELDSHMPSHHGSDVQTIIPDLNIDTVAIKAPTTLMHLHYVNVKLKKEATRGQILATWKQYRRIAMFSFKEGVKSTAQVMDFARDLNRNRGDLYEIAVWEEIRVKGRSLQYFQAVHQESDVVPENIDAIRAMFNLEKDGAKSVKKTDATMQIGI